MPRFEEDEEKQEEEVRSKYMFRPRLSAVAENDRFDVPFQNEYEQCCREDYDWDSELQTIKTVWERLKPPPQEKVEEKVLTIGNSRSLPWAPNEWCIERAFDCYRNRRDVARIHVKFLYFSLEFKIEPFRFHYLGKVGINLAQMIANANSSS
ncbi:unnamed protein product [Gongylonema pulchrum]|uniref:Uncharacterized protein n=1 Tax=Gongylonema pulchrum TaxID=637853 RepID=A0A183DDP9_9BILA|nr:unnamed protein product [Gongylonema pulchrum]